MPDDDDFARFYAANRHHVHDFLRKRVFDLHTVEDLAAEAFVRALSHWDQYVDLGKSRRAWITTITRNLLFDYAKSAQRREFACADMLDADHDEDDLTWRGVQAALAREEVARALRPLAPNQRRCLELRFLGERSVEETARELSLSSGAVKQLQLRALASARRNLQGARR